jgi:hypothetical protein
LATKDAKQATCQHRYNSQTIVQTEAIACGWIEGMGQRGDFYTPNWFKKSYQSEIGTIN